MPWTRSSLIRGSLDESEVSSATSLVARGMHLLLYGQADKQMPLSPPGELDGPSTPRLMEGHRSPPLVDIS